MTGFDIQHAMFLAYGVSRERDVNDIETIALRSFITRINRLLATIRNSIRETS